MTMKLIDLTGRVFGRLTVTGRGEDYVSPGLSRKKTWVCQCQCGTSVLVAGNNLTSGQSTSCGCLRREQLAAGNRQSKATHRMTKTRTYTSWASMRSRCTDPKNPAWPKYGGRSDRPVHVCDRWLNSFENFLEDMGERPAGKTLDRYPDPWGSYSPENCRWATPYEQVHNRRAA